MALDDIQRQHLVGVFRRLFDAHPAHVCLLDLDANILAVNEAWARFGHENGLPAGYSFEGTNYISVCEQGAQAGDPHAQQAITGLLNVLHTGRPKFVFTYPCHAPHERRWYRLWAEPQLPHASVIIVAHELERAEATAVA